MKKKFVVSYVLDYVHAVSVGIEAQNQDEALQIAEQAFDDALIWDNTETMPLLSDDYVEVGDEGMVWTCEPVEQFPESDHSVRQLNREQAAFRVCRELVDVYQRHEASSELLARQELERLMLSALEALGKTRSPP